MKSVSKKFIRIVARFMFLTFAASSGTILIAGTILIGKLAIAPIDLEYIKTQIEDSLSGFSPGSMVKIQQTRMIWDQEDHHIVIQASGVTFTNGSDNFNIPEINIGFKLTPLLHGNFIPKVIDLHRPHLRFKSNNDSQIQDFLDSLVNKNLMTLSQIKISNGSVTIEKFNLNHDLHFTDVNIEVSLRDKILVLDGSMKNKYAGFVVKAQGQFNKNGDLRVISSADLHGLSWENLPILWPTTLAPVPRSWVLENLSKGAVSKAGINIGVTILNNKFQNIKLERLDGEINFSGMTVHYLEGLPDVANVNGKAIYDTQSFRIKADQGKVNDLRNIKGDLLITDMDKENQFMKIDLDISGSLKSALHIIDTPGLKFASKYNISPNKISGDMDTKLKLEFPIETSLSPEQVKFSLTGDIKKAFIKDIFSNININRGDLSVNLNNEGIHIKGSSEIDGAKLDISWIEYFTPTKIQSLYEVKGTITANTLRTLGLNQYIDGSARSNLKYTVHSNGHGVLNATIDLKDSTVYLPQFGLISDQGRECNLYGNLLFSNHKLSGLENFKIEGDGLDIKLQSKFNHNTKKITSLHSTSFIIGNTDLNISAKLNKNGRYDIDVHASTLDLSNLLKSKPGDETNDFDNPYLLRIAINELSFGKDRKIYNVNGALTNSHSKWVNGYLQGKLRSENKKSNFNLNISTDGNTRSLIIRSNNAGELMKALGITDGISVGELNLTASQKLSESWYGNIVLTSFNLQGASALMKLLSMTSPMGIFDVVTGRPVAFDNAKVTFSAHEDGNIDFHKGFATGKSLGLTITGRVNRNNDQIKFHGQVMPMDFFNSFIRKIPLIREIAGGEHGAIFGVHYTMQGISDSPTIHVNPLSALTPGFLRNMFQEESPSKIPEK